MSDKRQSQSRFWQAAERAAAEVRTWPAWKREGFVAAMRVERQSFVDDLVMEDLVAHRDESRDQVKREREGAKQ